MNGTRQRFKIGFTQRKTTDRRKDGLRPSGKYNLA